MAKNFSLAAIFSLKDRLSAPLAKIRGQLTGLGKAGGKALGGLEKVADKGLGAMRKFADVAGVAGVVSLGALAFEMQNVMTHGAELEKTLIKTGTAFEKPVRAGTKGFAVLEAAARAVGKTTEFSAQQGAESLNSLATAGYTLEQSVAALPKIIDFASAATLELSQSSDIASDTLGAFSLRTADATKNAANMGRVMDALTRAAADSTTNVAELFEGIRAGGAFAATAGASLEQFVALQGVLANKGIKGAEAGTAIRNSFLHLTKQTKEAKNMMASLGVKVAKTKDGSIDMITTIGRFTKATSTLTRAKKAEAIATVFGAFTVGGFLSLMDSGEDSIRKFTSNLEHAKGVTAEMAAAMRESKAAKIAKFFNVLEDVRLTVFAAIAPTVLSIAESVGKWVSANQELIGTKAQEWATKLKDALPDIWKWTVRVGKAFAAFAVFAVTVKALNTVVLAYESAVKLAAIAVKAWGVAVKAATFVASVAMKAWGLAVEAATLVAGAAAKAWGLAVEAASVVASLAAKAWGVAVRAATVVASLAQKAWGLAVVAATLVASGAQWAYAAVVTKTTGVIVPAIGAQVAAMAPLLLAIGAASLAVGALYLAWDQFNKLDKDLAGSGGVTGTIAKMWDLKTIDPFKAHDAAMDEKAKTERDRRDRDDALGDIGASPRPQIISPQERAAAANTEAAQAAGGTSTVDGTITVEAKAGTKATVKAKTPRKALVLKPSGAFP